MNTKKQSISVVLPCFNEEQQIEAVVTQVHRWLKAKRLKGEIVVVNNGSTDCTGLILKRLASRFDELTIVQHRFNQGYGGSVRAGCDRAKMDVIAYMDSDGQYNVRDIDLLLPYLREVDFAAGIRRNRSDSVIRKTYAYVWNTMIRMLFGIRAVDIDCSMKVFRRELWPFIRPTIGKDVLFSAELFLRLKLNGFIWRQRSVRHYPRTKGTTSIGVFAIAIALYQLAILLTRLKGIKHNIRRRPAPMHFFLPLSAS